MKEGVSLWGRRLSYLDRLEVLERISRGETQPRVAAALGTTERTVRRVLAAAGGTPSRRSRRRPRSLLSLSLIEREEIRAGIAAGDSFGVIARRIGRPVVDRLARGRRRGGPKSLPRDEGRRPGLLAGAQAQALEAGPHPRLRRRVTEILTERFSPQQISARLKLEHRDDPEMRIAAETIYQSLY
jgi:IS30 family transposase